ncbi:MAG: rRNA maturation RNase YbeY [Oscillospiraceae bacterium]|nr:rRNA maturation RNase YbeY [Oscillospiraceae bacterium]
MQRTKAPKHVIQTFDETENPLGSGDAILITKAVTEVLQYEKVDIPCNINVQITGDKKIREYNRNFRGMDKATDVLSFPLQEFTGVGWAFIDKSGFDVNSDIQQLGDIVISAESAKKQAAEYENSYEYELAYLIIHSTLHLLGYIHDDEEREKIMHSKTKNIIREMELK